MKELFLVLPLFCVLFLCVSTKETVTKSPRINTKKSAPKSGPFRASILGINECKRPSKPYDKKPGVYVVTEIFNTSKKHSWVRGNVTIMKDFKRYYLKYKGFIWDNNKNSWQLMYMFNNIACDGKIMTIFWSFLGFNTKSSCVVPKGIYPFENLDYNSVEHLFWSGDRQYGRWLWRLEAYNTRDRTIICLDYQDVIEPE